MIHCHVMPAARSLGHPERGLGHPERSEGSSVIPNESWPLYREDQRFLPRRLRSVWTWRCAENDAALVSG